MKDWPLIAYLPESHAHKMAFFAAVSDDLGRGVRVKPWLMSFHTFPETQDRAQGCLARAIKQPKGAMGRWLKLMFLKGRYNWSRRYFERHPDAVALCWQGLTGARRAFMDGAKDAGAKRLFAELAPLPMRRTLDCDGVNAESSVPRNPSFYDDVIPDTALLTQVRDGFQARASRRPDVRQTPAMDDANGRFLFVPLQVPADSQLTIFGGWCGGISGFIDALAIAAEKLPDGWHLRLKEHPSSKTAVTPQIEAHIARGARLVLDNTTDSFTQIKASDGVVTINSSMGLQAMFWDKPVVITGEALYDIEGFVVKADGPLALGTIFENANVIPFDPGLRRRVLSWLARDYYVGFDGTKLHHSLKRFA